MRVIAGEFRGRRLHPPAGNDVRPTSDRLRETLFDILMPRIPGSRFLDLCSGTGAVAIEAISRGAESAVLVESSRRALSLIARNIESLSIGDRARVIPLDVLQALDLLARQQETYAGLRAPSQRFDIVFLDPPYASPIAARVMSRLGTGDLLAEDAIVVMERRVKTPAAPEFGLLRQYRAVKQGESALTFYSTA